MVKKSHPSPRREESLSRESIVDAAIELLDSSGEAGLTFRALSERLATGPGAIYWHVANKNDLLIAACDAVVARTMKERTVSTAPKTAIRALAMGMFDAMEEHPWVGSALTGAPGQLPVIRILEGIGQQLRVLGVAEKKQWAAVSVLLSYILGVAGQNASNSKIAQTLDADRSTLLGEVSAQWSQLDPDEYPFTRSVADQLRIHDDRKDFLAGIDLILSGLELQRDR